MKYLLLLAIIIFMSIPRNNTYADHLINLKTKEIFPVTFCRLEGDHFTVNTCVGNKECSNQYSTDNFSCLPTLACSKDQRRGVTSTSSDFNFIANYIVSANRTEIIAKEDNQRSTYIFQSKDDEQTKAGDSNGVKALYISVSTTNQKYEYIPQNKNFIISENLKSIFNYIQADATKIRGCPPIN